MSEAVSQRRRNVIVRCDGANNELGSEKTNVIRLVQSLSKQRLYYDPSVGTIPEPAVCGRLIQWISKVAGLAFGAGIIWKVEEAYTYLTSVWRPGDSNLAIRI